MDQEVGDLALALLDLGFEDNTRGGPLGVGLEFKDLRLQEDALEQLFDAVAGDSADFKHGRRAAPIFGDQVEARELVADLLGVGFGTV